MVSKLRLVLTLCLACFVLAACARNDGVTVSLEPTPLVSGGIGWGVVTIAYARLLEEPSLNAAEAGFARRGQVFELTARRRVTHANATSLWYLLKGQESGGWIQESSLRVHATMEQAQNSPEARP
ncbi:MAG TPA: hypothetical protein DCG47_06860 [Spirochaetaceae bacterium]|jgi:uncharacterized lipoprotein YajG|nr:hypothetical protein [Spirochaetaceae bacterium]